MNFGVGHVFQRQGLLTDNSEFPERDDDSVLQGQDFLPPPDAYTLLSAGIDTELSLDGSSFTLGVQVDNLLDTSYRDYLDRLRYFADARGREVRLRLTWNF